MNEIMQFKRSQLKSAKDMVIRIDYISGSANEVFGFFFSFPDFFFPPQVLQQLFLNERTNP